MSKRSPQPLKWHGGKYYLAPRIVALMPPHIHYVEPFGGGLAVLLAKDPEGISEVVNDSNRQLINFWMVLRDRFSTFQRKLESTPFSEEVWQVANKRVRTSDVNAAVDFFVRCRQSLAGRMGTFAPISRSRTRRGMNEQVSAWLTAIEGLPTVHQRLRRVAILSRPAVDVIRQNDGPETLFYLDPPYLPETRVAQDVYQHEMTIEQHERLLDEIRSLKGTVLLSGYSSPLYERRLCDWNRHTFHLPNNAAGGRSKKRMQECVWMNA